MDVKCSGFFLEIFTFLRKKGMYKEKKTSFLPKIRKLELKKCTEPIYQAVCTWNFYILSKLGGSLSSTLTKTAMKQNWEESAPPPLSDFHFKGLKSTLCPCLCSM